MSIFSHDTYDDALHLQLTRVETEWLHGGVGGLEPDSAILSIQFLEGDIGSTEKRHDGLAVLRRLPIFDDDEVTVADLLVDHGVSPDAQHIRIPAADEILRHGDCLRGGNSFNR